MCVCSQLCVTTIPYTLSVVTLVIRMPSRSVILTMTLQIMLPVCGAVQWNPIRMMQVYEMITFLHKVYLFIAVVMAALCNRAGHYIFALWFLLSIYLSFFLA